MYCTNIQLVYGPMAPSAAVLVYAEANRKITRELRKQCCFLCPGAEFNARLVRTRFIHLSTYDIYYYCLWYAVLE